MEVHSLSGSFHTGSFADLTVTGSLTSTHGSSHAPGESDEILKGIDTVTPFRDANNYITSSGFYTASILIYQLKIYRDTNNYITGSQYYTGSGLAYTLTVNRDTNNIITSIVRT